MPLFEVAITLHPTKNEAEEGKGEKLLMKPTAVVAKDAQSAAINVVLATDVPEEVRDADRNRMQVHVRPFV